MVILKPTLSDDERWAQVSSSPVAHSLSVADAVDLARPCSACRGVRSAPPVSSPMRSNSGGRSTAAPITMQNQPGSPLRCLPLWSHRDKELAKFEAFLAKEDCKEVVALMRGRSRMAYPMKG